MKPLVFLAAVVVPLTLFTAAAPAGKDANDYLTSDGQLKEVLEVREVKGGKASSSRWLWRVEKNGQWKKLQGKKMTEVAAGKLTKDQLAALAKSLAHYNLAGLTDDIQGFSNPYIATVQFGKHTATLKTAANVVPRPNDINVDGRIIGVVEAVRSALKEEKRER